VTCVLTGFKLTSVKRYFVTGREFSIVPHLKRPYEHEQIRKDFCECFMCESVCVWKPPYVEQCLAARGLFPINDTSITKIPLYPVSRTRFYDTNNIMSPSVSRTQNIFVGFKVKKISKIFFLIPCFVSLTQIYKILLNF
jgi:hypothetical protein